MKAQILQEDFSKALNISSRFVSARAQLPVLGNIVIKTQKNKLLLMATNLEMSFVTSLGAKIETEGEIAVPSRTTADLVSNLSKGSLTIEVVGEQFKIANESFESTLVGMNPSDFPSIPLDINAPLQVPREEFLRSVSRVLFCSSHDETRPVLTGVLFIFEKDTLSLVATDGFRLSRKVLKLSHEVDNKRTILPKNSLAEMLRVSTTGENISLEFKQSENQVVFGLGGGAGESILSTRVIEGDFPPFEKIIPKDHLVRVTIDKQELLQAVKASLVIARDSAYIGRLKVGEGKLEVSSESARSGKQKFSIDAKVEGEPIDILFNLHFIEEYLNNIEGDEVVAEFKDQTSPGVFHDPTDPQFLHLIMPLKM